MKQNEPQRSESAWEQLGRVRNYLENGIRPSAERVRIGSLIAAQQIIDHARRQCEPPVSPPQPTLTPLERLPLHQSNTEWALRFGSAWRCVKNLKEIDTQSRIESTPELHNEQKKLIHFLWSKHPDVAEELALPKAETQAADPGPVITFPPNAPATPAAEAGGKDQVPLIDIFKGNTESAKLKRVVAMRYISHNPSQAEMVAWLQSVKPPKPIPAAWKNVGLVDWEDAFKKRPQAVKSFFSKLTGALRKGGHVVGRTGRAAADVYSKKLPSY